jgi:hypothetical protein
MLLATTVDTFIKENVADVVEKSLEFTQLQCIKVSFFRCCVCRRFCVAFALSARRLDEHVVFS